MKTSIILTLLLLPLACFSQKYITQDRQQVKTGITRLKLGTVQQTDSTLILTVKKGNSIIIHQYLFDQKDKCISETVNSTCESCIEKELKSILAISKYQWKKVNENQYASRFEDKLVIELPADKKDQYTIMFTDWSRTLYDMLTGK